MELDCLQGMTRPYILLPPSSRRRLSRRVRRSVPPRRWPRLAAGLALATLCLLGAGTLHAAADNGGQGLLPIGDQLPYFDEMPTN